MAQDLTIEEPVLQELPEVVCDAITKVLRVFRESGITHQVALHFEEGTDGEVRYWLALRENLSPDEFFQGVVLHARQERAKGLVMIGPSVILRSGEPRSTLFVTLDYLGLGQFQWGAEIRDTPFFLGPLEPSNRLLRGPDRYMDIFN